MNLKIPAFLILFLMLSSGAVAQDDLLELLEDSTEETTDYAIATFKSTRLINGQTIETTATGVMQFVIGHRFGRVNLGFRELFGLDNSTIRIGLEYGIVEGLTFGIGRSSFEKTYDGYFKYRLLKQSKGKRLMPLSVTLFTSMAINTLKYQVPERENYFSSRLYYTFQVLIARKITRNLSLQLSPTLVHRNLVPTIEDNNDVFTLGAGGRYKISKSISVNIEYFWVPKGQIESKVNGEKVSDALSIGIDIETGGHVFQLHFTNSRGMIEKAFATETTGKWLDGDIHFGFNITRVFTVAKYGSRRPYMKKKHKTPGSGT